MEATTPSKSLETVRADELWTIEAVAASTKSTFCVETVRAVTVTDTYDYTAFGELYAQTGTTPNNYLYTGQQYDEVTGLYSLRARYYNPSDGRFLSRDTYAYNYQNPIELNRYGYAANNPVTNYDPSGQFALMAYDRTIKDISMENIPILSLLGKGVLFLWNVVWWSLRFLIAVSPVLATLGPLVAPNTAPPPPGSVWDPYNQNNWDLWRDTAPPDVVVDPPTIPCSGGSRCDANPYDDTIPEYENPTENSRETDEETSARQQREGPRYADPPQPPPEENDGESDCDPNCVVRAGVAAPENLIKGYGPVRDSELFGFSVQYRPGTPLQELASVGFPNSLLSYARDTEIILAGLALGYIITITPTPQGWGAYHSTVTAYKEGEILKRLPEDLALALSIAFRRKMNNPNPVKR